MRSPRGFSASVIFLSLLPAAVLYQIFFDNGIEVVTHFMLAAGTFLISLAVFDFKVTKWINRIGFAATFTLAVIFLLQGASLLIQNDLLTYIAYQILGQRLEALLGDLLILWFAAMLLFDSRGKTKILGVAAVSIAIGLEIYKYILSYFGDVPAEGLKLFFLLLIVWFLFESKKKLIE